jgi:hypothetical protein
MPPKRKRDRATAKKAKSKSKSKSIERKLVQNVPGIPPYFANFVDIEESDAGRSFIFTSTIPKKYGTVSLIAKFNRLVTPTANMGEPFYNHPFYVVTDAHILTNTFMIPAGSKVEYPTLFKLAGRPRKLKSIRYTDREIPDVEVFLPSMKWKVQEVWNVGENSVVGIPKIGALPENVQKSILNSIYGYSSARQTHRNIRPQGPVFGPHPNIHVPSTAGLFTNMMNL